MLLRLNLTKQFLDNKISIDDQKFRILAIKFYQKSLMVLYLFLQKMGGVVKVVEAVLASGFIAQEISEIVLKEKIKKLVSQYEDEFELMNRISQLIDPISFNKNSLQSQLRTNILFVQDNWNSIFNSFEDQSRLLNFMVNEIPDVMTCDQNYTFQTGQKFGVSILVSAYIAYSYISGKKKTSISQDFASVQKFCRQSSGIIRSFQPQIQVSKVSLGGEIKKELFKNKLSNLPKQLMTSVLGGLISQQQMTSIKSKVESGISVAKVGSKIYKFIKGTIALAQLGKTLKQKQDFFKEEGQFRKAEEGILQLMKIVAVDIFNLAHASQMAIFQTKNVLMAKSITLPRYNEEVLKFSNKIDVDSVGLSGQFFQQSYNLIDFCNQISNSGKNIKGKLQDLKIQLEKFVGLHNPSRIFMNAASSLSKLMGQYSLVSPIFEKDQRNVNRFFTQVSAIFKQQRGKTFFQKTSNQKKTVDSIILNQVFNKYTQIFKLQIKFENISQEIKDVLFQAIISFADEFYSEDDSGQTFFGKNIRQSKSNISYKQLLDSFQLVKEIDIPVHARDEKTEKQRIKEWLAIGDEKNKEANFAYWEKEIKPTSVFRYISLKPETQKKTMNNEKEFKILSCSEGIRVLANKSYLNLERSVLRGSVTLEKV